MKKHAYNTYFSFVHQVTEHNLPEVNEAGEDRLPKIGVLSVIMQSSGCLGENREFVFHLDQKMMNSLDKIEVSCTF